jgi:hypothetical protein
MPADTETGVCAATAGRETAFGDPLSRIGELLPLRGLGVGDAKFGETGRDPLPISLGRVPSAFGVSANSSPAFRSARKRISVASRIARSASP